VAPYHFPTNNDMCQYLIRPCPPTLAPFHVSLSVQSASTCHTPVRSLPIQLYRCATCHHCNGATCHSLNRPPVFPISMPTHFHVTCTSVQTVRSAATSTLYRLYNQQILPVWPNEQITIYFEYNVRLSLFKLHWVRIDEAYTHIHFEEILRTLIFRPSWTHFGSWIQFWIIHFFFHRFSPLNTFRYLNLFLKTTRFSINRIQIHR
jgi:hypothetical protein